VGALPEAECRWAVYDLAFEKDGGKRTKLAFVMWCVTQLLCIIDLWPLKSAIFFRSLRWHRSPDDAKIKNKMLYASSKDALRRSLDGIAVEIQGTSYDEVTYESCE
jgi:cofilin